MDEQDVSPQQELHSTQHSSLSAEIEQSSMLWRSVAWAVLIMLIAFTVHAAAALVLSIIVAALLALLLAPAVSALTRWRIPTSLAAAIVMLLGLGIVVTLASNLYGPVQKWASIGPAELRTIDRKLRALVRPVQSMKEVADKVADIADGESKNKPREVVVDRDRGTSLTLLITVQEAVFSVLTTIMLTYFLLASGDTFLRKTVRVIPRLRGKIRAVEIAREVQSEIGRYFMTITIVSVGLGAATGLAMWLLGMPTPLLWGVMATLFNFVPYLGPIVSMLVIAAVSLFTFDEVTRILAAPAVFALFHFIEGNVVEPLVVGDRFSINPVIIFVWVLAWGWLGGAIGVLIAVPLLVALRICASHIPELAVFYEITGYD